MIRCCQSLRCLGLIYLFSVSSLQLRSFSEQHQNLWGGQEDPGERLGFFKCDQILDQFFKRSYRRCTVLRSLKKIQQKEMRVPISYPKVSLVPLSPPPFLGLWVQRDWKIWLVYLPFPDTREKLQEGLLEFFWGGFRAVYRQFVGRWFGQKSSNTLLKPLFNGFENHMWHVWPYVWSDLGKAKTHQKIHCAVLPGLEEKKSTPQSNSKKQSEHPFQY